MTHIHGHHCGSGTPETEHYQQTTEAENRKQELTAKEPGALRYHASVNGPLNGLKP